MGHALHQVLGVGRERGANHFRVGEREVRRREGRQHLVQVEESFLARLLVDALGVAGEILSPAGGNEIGLLPEIEELPVGPIGVLEAVVAGLRHDHGLDLLAEKPAEGTPPEIGIALEEFALRRGELAGLGHPMARDLAERLRRLARFRGHAIGTLTVRAGALGERGERLRPLVEEAHHVPG